MAGTAQTISVTAGSAADTNTKKVIMNDGEIYEDQPRWRPSGNTMKDFLFFVGPGWMVCIAYIDPGNYQANIQAGATTGYRLLWTIWWMSVISLYCQILCVRLAVYAQVTLSEAQAMHQSKYFRYLNWAIAEFSAVITDIPEVIAIGIALNVFFGWPYIAGVLLSFFTTMGFLALQRFGMRPLEAVIAVLVGIMGITIIIESFLCGYSTSRYMEGWVYGFVETQPGDIWAIIGIIGAVVMPHNLYLHSASVLSRPVERSDAVVRKAVAYMSWEPVLPIIVSFFISAATVIIAAVRIDGAPNADNAGLTDFYTYVQSVPGSRWLWGLSLLAAGQSSAITTTYSGQYIMDGFLKIRLPMWKRALLTRLTAIVPCCIVALSTHGAALNTAVDIVNAALAVLLPFALTPLVKYCTSQKFMGPYATGPVETVCAWGLAFAVYLFNAITISVPGGGMFGDMLFGKQATVKATGTWVILFVVMLATQLFLLVWNAYIVYMPITQEMQPLQTERVLETEFTVAKEAREISNANQA
jgi:NRAMP (natural resistance-associated macrophage protein)-like metal ion transporter